MKFITVTLSDNTIIYINTNSIESFRSSICKEGNTRIDLTDGPCNGAYFVKETVDEILTQVRGEP